MSQSRVNTDGLSQHSLLMPCAARPPVCQCWLIFPAVFVFKALRWAFKRLLRWRWRPPSDFPSLSPPVHCPFQCLIYGPHKCARDTEISEEVIYRTKPRKRAGKRKRTEEVTKTCRVKASEGDEEGRENFWLIIPVDFLYCICCLSSCFFSFLPASWPLNFCSRVWLPVVCSPNWSQDTDALAALDWHIKHTVFLRLNQHRAGGWTE